MPQILTERWPAHQELLKGQLEEIMKQHPQVKFTLQQTSEAGWTVPLLQVTSGRPLTVRRFTGNRCRLYARLEGGGHRNNIKIGAVVVRGLLDQVYTNLPRQQRKDYQEMLFEIHPYGFYPSIK